jgi:hypothetical protein
MDTKVGQEGAPQEMPVPVVAARGRWVMGWSSLLFAILQSACTVVMAASGLRLLIGVGATIAATGLLPLEKLHTDWLRIPMVLLAVAGSVLNLFVIWQIRTLRARPSSQWRMTPVTKKQKRSEQFQIVLAIVTLIVVAVEESFHLLLFHHG